MKVQVAVLGNGARRAQCKYGKEKKNLKKNSLCGAILQSLFQIFKNWLKRISALTAYVWGAAPCSTLPTADENAVTESAVTTVSSSLFQSATVLTKNEFLYCSVLLSGIFKPQEFQISCLAMVLS